jgi:type IV secretion system protein VirB10
MASVAAGMLLIIVVTGRSSAPRRPADATASPAAASALSPDRLRRYQDQLAEQEAQLRQELASAQAAAAATPQALTPTREPAPQDPIAEEQRRREYTSLFAETVAFTRRAAVSPAVAAAASAAPAAASAAALTAASAAATARAERPATSSEGQKRQPGDAKHEAPGEAQSPPKPPGDTRRLLEGTVIEAVLTNRLEGSFSNPVNALVTTEVYEPGRQTVVIPAGARVLGTASPVQAFGETRLAVTFHRLVMPDGTTYDLDRFTGLNERGDAGLKDQVDRHYLQIFGASIAIGGLSGLAQYSTRSGANGNYGFSDAFGQGLGGSLAASGGRILDRFLNVLPGVTIREGHRLRIYLTRDLELPPYHDQSAR